LVAVLFNAWDFASLWIDHDQAYEDAQVQVRGLAREVSRTLTGTLRTAEFHLTDHLVPVASDFLGGRIGRHGVQSVFVLTIQRLPQVAAVVVFDAAGRLAAASIPLAAEAADVGNSAFFARHRDEGVDQSLFVDDEAPLLAEGRRARWSLLMTRALFDHDGRFSGVVMIVFSTERFFSFIDEMNIVGDAMIRIFDSSGRLLVNHPRDAAQIGRSFRDHKLFASLSPNKDETVGRMPDPTDDTPEIGAFHAVERYPLWVSVGVSEDLALAEWWRELAILLLTVVVFMLASSWAVRRRLARWVLGRNARGAPSGFIDGDGI
jgi:hypothetical protein